MSDSFFLYFHTTIVCNRRSPHEYICLILGVTIWLVLAVFMLVGSRTSLDGERIISGEVSRSVCSLYLCFCSLIFAFCCGRCVFFFSNSKTAFLYPLSVELGSLNQFNGIINVPIEYPFLGFVKFYRYTEF